MLHTEKHGWLYTGTSSRSGFIVSGRPNCSRKNFCVGILHMLVHMPTQPEFSRYRHFFIFTPLFHTCFSPLKTISASWTSEGPTSHLNPIVVISALISAFLLFRGNHSLNRSGDCGGRS